MSDRVADPKRFTVAAELLANKLENNDIQLYAQKTYRYYIYVPFSTCS